MSHLFAYRLRSYLRDRASVFWTLVFPILLATFFYLAFADLTQGSEGFSPVSVAVVQAGPNSILTEALASMSGGESPLLLPEVMEEQAAREKLAAGEVDGVIFVSGEPWLLLSSSGISQSILKTGLDAYVQTIQTVGAIAASNPASAGAAAAALASAQAGPRQISLSGGDMDSYVQNFYSLIAMSCVYGGFFGLSATISAQANLSALGARRCVSPTRKSRQLMADLLAAVLMSYAIILILVAYLRFVLGIAFGSSLGAILLLCLMGCLAGTVYAMLLGLLPRLSKSAKEGMLISTTMVMSFLAGLMYPNMRFVVEKSVPLVNRVNPAALLVDGFYALDAYGAGSRYWQNIGLLALITALLYCACVLVLRRKQYASI